MKEKIVIIGGGGHSKVIINILINLNIYNILGYTDINDKGKLLGVKYLGNDEILKNLIKENKNCKAVIGIGNIKVSDQRRQVYERVKKIGYDFPVIISKNAIIHEGVKIGEGTVIFDGAVVNIDSKIGKCSIINTGAIIEYECSIGDFVHITPCSILNHNVNIGDDSFIGSGSFVLQKLKISNKCLIGAGSVITSDILKEGKYWGNPAVKRD